VRYHKVAGSPQCTTIEALLTLRPLVRRPPVAATTSRKRPEDIPSTETDFYVPKRRRDSFEELQFAARCLLALDKNDKQLANKTVFATTHWSV